MEIIDIDVVNILIISFHVEINMYCCLLALSSVIPNIYNRDEEQNGPLLILPKQEILQLDRDETKRAVLSA